jgi:SAM-dependent methyltransferase
LNAVEPGTFLLKKVQRRTTVASMPIELMHTSAERLPYDSSKFDCVVSTWTLCTIPDVRAALLEVRRVLKPGGQFIFLEHGLSNDPSVVKWQDRLTPIQRVIACGCHFNRPIDKLIKEAGFKFKRLNRYQMSGIPRFAGEMYRGLAVPITSEVAADRPLEASGRFKKPASHPPAPGAPRRPSSSARPQ